MRNYIMENDSEGGTYVREDRLRALRERKGLTQGGAAKKMGIVRTTYSNYEAGNREPDNDTLRKFAEFYEVSTDYLLGNNTTNDQARNAVIEEYNRLPQEERKIVDDMIKALVAKRQK